MVTIGLSEAGSQLPNLVDRVAQGELITITKQGVPVARIVPVPNQNNSDLSQVIQDIKEYRKGRRLEGLSIREMIEEGRR
ncbi:MAG: type II toxin-antitoxin system prevent-host-death family antitoxin [Thermoguttaceae bacterium]|jgi:prevent-host-death family protein